MDIQVTEIRVVFSLVGKAGIELDLQKITKEIGINPTRIRTLADWPNAIKNPKTELPEELRPRCIWKIDIGYESEMLVRNRFGIMMKILEPKIDIINNLKRDLSLSASFTIGIHAQHDPHNMPELYFTQDIVAFIASIGADVGFDMYLD